MNEEGFREWLEANGANSEAGRNTRVFAVGTIEKNLGALGFASADLDAAWSAGEFEAIRAALSDLRKDYDEGGERYRILMPQSEKPRNRLASWRSWLGQYGRFLAGDGVGVTDAERIRYYVLETYIEPARERDDTFAEFLVKAVNDQLGLKDAWPNICQAMRGRKFQELADVPPPQSFGADMSSATRFRFDLDRENYWAQSLLISRLGKPIAQSKKMVSFLLGDGRQLALDLEAARAQVWVEGHVPDPASPDLTITHYAANAPRHSNLPPRLKPTGPDARPVSLVTVSNEEALAKLLDVYEAGQSALDREALEQLRKRFIKRFPDFESGGGFTGRSTYHPEEDDYKRTMLAEIEPLRGSTIGALPLGAKILDMLLSKQSNLLGYYKTGQRLEAIRKRHPDLLEQAIGQLAQSNEAPPQAAETFISAAWPLLLEGSEDSKPYGESRILATVVQALTRPMQAISVIYQRFHNLGLALLGESLFGNQPLSAVEYARILKLANEIFDVMRDDWKWGPRDLWDVQGFVWTTCGEKLSTKRELDPTPIWIVTARWGEEDGLPRFLKRGEWSLLTDTGSPNNDRVREMQVGDWIVARDYFHQVHDLPFDANGGRVSAMRLRALGRVSEPSQDNLRIGVEWEQWDAPRTWYFYTHPAAVWRVPDRGKNEMADQLRRFILDGAEQDYPFFFNEWRDSLFGSVGAPEELPMNPTNLILYGPPGTGKTFATARHAVSLCDGSADFPDDDKGRAALMRRYDELRGKGQIGFVTFHQSFSYEDFVEGLRPVPIENEDGTSLGFHLEAQSGVFKQIAEQAQTSVTTDVGTFDLSGRTIYKMSLGELGKADSEFVFTESMDDGVALLGFRDIDWSDPRFEDRDEILAALREKFPDEEFTLNMGPVRAPDVFRNELQTGDVLIVPKGNQAFRAVGVVEGEYEYAPRPGGRYCHRRKVRWLWSDPAGRNVRQIYSTNFQMNTIYRLKDGELNLPTLAELVGTNDSTARRMVAEPHVLIIDEINRANISKVFGELITLIEPDKRLGMRNALKVRLPYSKREFGVPANLHIIGTMNTADRSIALLDTALRRRFRFEEVAPDSKLLPIDVEGVPLRRVFEVINDRVEYLVDRDHRIGHAFFMEEGGESHVAIDATMRDKVIPLLQEYFFEDWSRLAAVLGETAETASGGKGAFLDCRKIEDPTGNGGPARESWALKPHFAPDAYDRLIGKVELVTASEEPAEAISGTDDGSV